MDTIQKCLAAIYSMLGGDLDNIRNKKTIDELLAAISGLGVGDKLKAAVEFPAAPEDDGTYVLTCTVDEGEATYTWEAAAAGE